VRRIKRNFGFWGLITVTFFLISSTAAWAELTATHSAEPSSYVAGSDVTVTNTIEYTFTEALTTLGITVNIPEGWTFVSVGGDDPPATKSSSGATGPLEFYWTTPPNSPINFTYTLHVPDGETGTKHISSQAEYRVGTGGAQHATFTPDPLSLNGPPGVPNISISPESKDFGSVLIGSSSDETFTISNIGTDTLNVSSIAIEDSPEFSLDTGTCGSTPSLEPTESCTVTVTFSPTSEGEKSANLKIISNANNTPTLNVSLTGIGQTVPAPNISISPESKDFGSVLIGSSSDETFTISNIGTDTLNVSSIAIEDSPEFSLDTGTCDSRPSLEPGASCTVTVTFSPTSEGEKSANLKIISNANNTPTLDVSLSGKGVWLFGNAFGVKDNKVIIEVDDQEFEASLDGTDIGKVNPVNKLPKAVESGPRLTLNVLKGGDVADDEYEVDLGLVVDDVSNERRIEAVLKSVKFNVLDGNLSVTIPEGAKLYVEGRSADGYTIFATVFENKKQDGPVYAEAGAGVTFDFTRLRHKVESKFGTASGEAEILREIQAEGQYAYTILVKSPIPIGYVEDGNVFEFPSCDIGLADNQYGANLADIGIHRYIVTELTGLSYILYGSFGVAYDAPTAVGEFPRENSANSPPKAQDQSKDTNKNTAVDITLEAIDADGDPLTYSIVDDPIHGTLSGFDAATGNVTYTPDPGYAGKDSFTFKANDGIADSDIATVTITIKNRVPEAKIQSVTTYRNKPVGITLEATDADNDPLTYIIVSYPTGTLSGTPPNVIYTPKAGYTGTDSFEFKANDGIADSNIATVSITIEAPPVNHKPAALEQSLTTMENTPVDIILMAVDEDADPLTYIIVDDPDHGTLSGFDAATGNVTYTPDAGYTGTDSFTFKANDGEFDSNVAVVNITVSAVNHAPVAEDQSVTTDQNTPVDIQLAATDADGDTLTYSIVDDPIHGTLSGFDAATGNVTYTPDPDYAGTDSFTFKANDGKVDSNIATVSITVTFSAAVNHAPVAEDQSVTTDQNTSVNITLEATDIDGDTLTYIIFSLPSNGTLKENETVISSVPYNLSDNTVTYTPNVGYAGTDSFTFKAKDDEDTDSNTATVTINVTLKNHAPVAQDQIVSTPMNNPVSITLVATDIDNGRLTYIISSLPSNGTLKENGIEITQDELPFSLSGNTVTYDPGDYAGNDSFTFKANDGEFDSDVATVFIIVSAPKILVSKTEIDFGSIRQNTTTKRTLAIGNTGNADLTITDLVITGTDSSEFSILIGKDYCSGKTLSSGDSCTVDVTFSPTSAGAKSAALTIYSDDPDNPAFAVELSGIAIAALPEISYEPTSLDFGSVYANYESDPKVITISNTGNADLIIGSISTDVPDFLIQKDNCSGKAIAAGSSCTVEMVFMPSSTGDKSAKLTIPSNVPAVNVELSGTGVNEPTPDIAVSPDSLNFTDTMEGDESEIRTVTVTNTGTAGLNITGISITDSSEFSQTNDCGTPPVTLSPGDSCTVDVTFMPSSAGDKSANLGITSNDPDEPTINVTLNGTAIASNPEISVAESIDFGAVTIGETSSVSVSIGNNGNADLNITGISISGTDGAEFSQTNDCAIVSPGASCTVDVTFKPESSATGA